ncbi:MAG: TonB-dependent receptor [Gallionella sp.]|nr:TonB-dependent receptor [Gallionella sp.]
MTWSLGMACGSAWATDYPTEQVYFQELPVVLSASRLSQPVSETPNAMTVIDREMIVASGFRNIADLFRLVPGMYVGYDYGNAPFVTYHGTTDQYARRMQVLVDGRSVYLPPFGGVRWLDIPLHLDDIERIEVIRGPAAAAYGANSLQGVISIITREAAGANGATVSLAKGNGGISDVAARLGSSGEQLDYRATLASRSDDGHDLAAMNDGSTVRHANLRANYRFNMQDSVDFQLGYSDATHASGMAGRVTDPFRDMQTETSFQQIGWLHALPGGDEFKLNYYHISLDYRDSAEQALEKDNNQVHRHELGMQHTMSIGHANRMVWGGTVRRDTLTGTVLFREPQSLRLLQLFAHDEWRVMPSLLANLGAMAEDDGMGHRNLSPRVSLNYHLTPEHTLRVGASVAYRSPVMFEQNANTAYASWRSRPFMTVGDLRPERVFSREIGYLGELAEADISIDARIYQDRVSDYIYLDPQPTSPRIFSFKNLYAIQYQGLEGTFKYRLGKHSDLILNYAHQRSNCTATGSMTMAQFDPYLADYIVQCPLNVPADSASILLARQLTPELQLGAGYYHQEKVQVTDAQWPQPLMRRLDLRMAYAFGRQGKPDSGEVALVVQNAFQDNYTEYSNVPQKAGFVFNRRAYLTATLKF